MAIVPAGADARKPWYTNLATQVQDSFRYLTSRKAAGNATHASKKLLWSTGKAAWIAGTTFLILVVPLIIEMDREQQLLDIESQQGGLLGAPTMGQIPPPVLTK